MGRRMLLGALVVAAPLADAAGSRSLAFWSLVAAVGVAAVCGLASFGSYLDGRDDPLASLQAFLWAPVNLLLLVAAVARGPEVAAGDVPRLGVTAVAAALVVLAFKLVLHVGVELYRSAAAAGSASRAHAGDAVASRPAR